MNAQDLFSLGFLWMAAAGIASGIAKRNGWSEGIWFLAAMALGPFAWMALFVKLRASNERVAHRRSAYRRVRPRATARTIR